MKKIFTVILFSLFPLTASFGVDFTLSAGGGALTGGLFTRYTLTGEGAFDDNVPADIRAIQEMDQISYGGFLFLDATWVEFSLSFQGGANTWMETSTIEAAGEEPKDSKNKGKGLERMLGISLLGKYPFVLNRHFTLFPLAGLEYQVALAQYRQEGNHKYDSRTRKTDSKGVPYKISVWNSLLVDIGAGLDFVFIPRMFLRTELLYGFRLMTPYEVDALDLIKEAVKAPSPKLAGLTSGPTLRLSLGYLF